MVKLHVFNSRGELVGPVDSEKLSLSDDEWRKRLTPEQFRVLRSAGTERPFCGALLDNKQPGVYSCAACGLPLFTSDSKFHSGTGWPSFFQPIAPGNVAENTDYSHGMSRTEINCARCDGHLGHVFNDGPRPTGLRYCMNSESLNFTPSDLLASLADPLASDDASGAMPTPAGRPLGPPAGRRGHEASADMATQGSGHGTQQPSTTATAVFAGGCFWCTEAAFEQLEGVLDVTSGYTGGTRDSADYESVCTGRTGHAEAVRVTYDPAKISYDTLLDVFFDAHDPTQLNRQGADVGTQYRSAIFCSNESERRAAEAKIKQLNESHHFPSPIVTTLEPLVEFFPAEDYHQDYARNNPTQPYIQAAAIPKACKVREKHAGLIRKR